MPKLTAGLIEQASKQDSGLTIQARNKQITSLEGISDLVPVKVETLDFSLNMIQEIGTHLSTYIYLKHLDLSTNLITKISGLNRLDYLESLKLSRNRIPNIEGLGTLKRLKFLDLSLNKIKDIEGLENLYNLNTLYLYGNQIEILRGLENLRDLKMLRIEQNKIDNITHCAVQNRSLEVLEAHSNKIEDMNSVIVALSHMKALKSLSLYNNPIERDLSYKVRIMSYRNIEKVDGLEIKDYMRDALYDINQQVSIESAVDLTASKYHALMKVEQELKDAAVNRLKSQIQHLEEDFRRYNGSLQKEMDGLNAYAGMIHHKRLQGEDITQDTRKLQEWSQKVLHKEEERRAEIDAKIRSLKESEANVSLKIQALPSLHGNSPDSQIEIIPQANSPNTDYQNILRNSSQISSPPLPRNSSQVESSSSLPHLHQDLPQVRSSSISPDPTKKSSFPIIGDTYLQEIQQAVESANLRNDPNLLSPVSASQSEPKRNSPPPNPSPKPAFTSPKVVKKSSCCIII